MRAQPSNNLNDWWRILAMGTVLAGLVFLLFFYNRPTRDAEDDGPAVTHTVIPVPELDFGMLELARDDTREQRLTIEARPLAHLLQRSINIVPSIARALEMPEDEVPITKLRADPDRYRGRYLWYGGQLKYLSRGKSGHPVEGFKIYEGWIETDGGDEVLFRVSVEPVGIEVGDFVRMEGFLMKLHDSYSLPKTDEAPLLVGPQLFEAYPNWEDVAVIDPSILDEVDDRIDVATAKDGQGGGWDELPESQYLPLWHLTSYARHRGQSTDLTDWRAIPAFVKEDQFNRIRDGQVARGEPFRVLGMFVSGRTWEARPNPIGVQVWSRAEVQIPDLGGKVVRIWTPGTIDLKRGDGLEVRSYYFRRQLFEPVDKRVGVKFLPIFVADQLHPYTKLPQHESASWVKWGFLALVVGVIGLFFGIARRDRAQQSEHMRHMDERRRRRRELAAQRGSDDPGVASPG